MQKLTIGLEWFLNPDHVPFLIGLEKGWFEAAGIEIELIEPAEHLDAIEEIEAGKMDIAVTEPLHLVEDRAKGHKVKGFARFLHTNGGVMYFAESGIKRPSDMAGKRIQYPGAPGNGGPAIVGTMIKADGGEYDPNGFERVNNGFYHTNALIEDKADVATLAFYNFEVVEARHRGHDAQFFALKDWGVPDFCQLILITNEETLSQKKALISKFLEVTSRGIDFLHQNPEEAREIYFRRTNTDPEEPLMKAIFEATVPCFTFDFTMSRSYYDQLSAWMSANELAERDVTFEESWTNGFA